MNVSRAHLSLLVLLLALAFLCFVPGQVWAENLGPGGGTRVAIGDQKVGAYRLLVPTSPDPAQTGILTIVARVTNPGTGAVMRDAQVDVELVNDENGVRLSHAASHKDAGNPVDYVAHIPVEQAGSYRVAIRIQGPLGPAQAAFDQRILAPRSSSTLLFLGLPFLLVLAILGVVWYVRAAPRPGRRAEADL
jgi:hypothetical protein